MTAVYRAQRISGQAVYGDGLAAPLARYITLILRDRAGNPRGNLSGLHWALAGEASVGTLASITDSGTNGTTDASGLMTLTFPNSTLAAGATAVLLLSNNGAEGDSNNFGFVSKVTLL